MVMLCFCRTMVLAVFTVWMGYIPLFLNVAKKDEKTTIVSPERDTEKCFQDGSLMICPL